MIKIIIVGDHAVVRSGFSHLLNFQTDMQVIATAADGNEAYELVLEHQPDILMLDVSMPPGESDLITTAKIHQAAPQTKQLLTINAVKDDSEEMVRYVGTFSDITDLASMNEL